MALSTAVLSTAAPRDYGPRIFMEQGGDSLRGTSSGRILMGVTSSGFLRIKGDGTFTQSTAAGTMTLHAGVTMSTLSANTLGGVLTISTAGSLRLENIHHSSSDGLTVAANKNIVIVDTTKITTLPRPIKGRIIDCFVQTTKLASHSPIRASSSKTFLNSSGLKANGVNVTHTSSALMVAGNGGIGCHVKFFGYSTTLWYVVAAQHPDFWTVAPSTYANLA